MKRAVRKFYEQRAREASAEGRAWRKAAENAGPNVPARDVAWARKHASECTTQARKMRRGR